MVAEKLLPASSSRRSTTVVTSVDSVIPDVDDKKESVDSVIPDVEDKKESVGSMVTSQTSGVVE